MQIQLIRLKTKMTLTTRLLTKLAVISFFFNDTAPTEIYTLSLLDALPISRDAAAGHPHRAGRADRRPADPSLQHHERSEEHTSELQSRFDLVCRFLLE